MIDEIKIKNFKCFLTSTNVPLSKITVCTGMNSVGKSTLIQAILLMWESYNGFKNNADKNVPINVLINTSALKLGSTTQIMPDKHMMLSANDMCFHYAAGEDKLSLILENREDMVRGKLFDSMLYYLNAERVGPRSYQQMRSLGKLHCGYYGEYTFDVIQKNPLREISEKRHFAPKSDSKTQSLDKQIDLWVSYIVNGVEVNFTSNIDTQTAQMQVRQPALDTPKGSPNNFGFGISYVLPIITTGLIAEKKSIVIIENPEAHLHPAGQSRIGEFLAQISCDDVQVIIETHSEHVLNGIRKYALKNEIKPEDVCINYFSVCEDSQNNKNSSASIEINRLPLNERMDILNWPNGFFDQEALDLKELRLLRGATK